MLPLVKKWQIVSGYYDLKSHFRSNDHMLFALNLSYAFSSSLLVFSHINIGAKIMIFWFSWIAVSVSEVMIFRTKGMQWGTFAHRVHTEKFE